MSCINTMYGDIHNSGQCNLNCIQIVTDFQQGHARQVFEWGGWLNKNVWMKFGGGGGHAWEFFFKFL